ncbi:MAG: hypothetical protein PHY30_03670, partial [Candidatus Pacebacteria bacterium]|nr:hypothetical protein [Candidatus Paceibacterota bacterium]
IIFLFNIHMNAELKKRSLGQFFTKNDLWLKSHILEFIKRANADIAFDPFAGEGDLLEAAQKIGFKKTKGFDIDGKLGWETNDSLVNIAEIKNSMIITNPPYLTNYSAKRKGVYGNVEKYFEACNYDDLYQLAIDRCLRNNKFGIAIIPETFINSKFPKNRLSSITIIEDKMFDDTDVPVCVICFDDKIKSYNEIKVYKNNLYLGNLGQFEKRRKIPAKNIPIKFNSPYGQIALRAVDATTSKKNIQFMHPEAIDYDLSFVRESSRLITLIEVEMEQDSVDRLIDYSNEILISFRKEMHDVLLSPFKGNKKNGERRRRLDYGTARAILEEAYAKINHDCTLL